MTVGVGVSVAVGVGVNVAVALGVWVGVRVAVGVTVAVGLAVAVGVGVGVGPECAQYLPPVFKTMGPVATPPQTIISLPVHTAVCRYRAAGVLLMLVATQLFISRSYLPPDRKSTRLNSSHVSES